MVNRYFIIGTDTNCGKTYVTCQLLSHLQKNNHKAMAIKPVASGCKEEGGIFINDDIVELQNYNGSPEKAISAWCFKPPISPHLAAAEVGQVISAQDITDFCYDESFVDNDILLIESAGGLMSPLNEQETWRDVLACSNIPVIFVVGMRLGCLNHALLTALALGAQQTHCIGWIANCLDKDMLALPENIATLSQRMEWPLLATISYRGRLENLNNDILCL